MRGYLKLCFGTIVRRFPAHRNLLPENLALRQQLAVLKRRNPPPRLAPFDKFFWVVARRVWSGGPEGLIIVVPETVVRWHRIGLRLYWRWVARARGRVGRKPTMQEVRNLIFRLVAENST